MVLFMVGLLFPLRQNLYFLPLNHLPIRVDHHIVCSGVRYGKRRNRNHDVHRLKPLSPFYADPCSARNHPILL